MQQKLAQFVDIVRPIRRSTPWSASPAAAADQFRLRVRLAEAAGERGISPTGDRAAARKLAVVPAPVPAGGAGHPRRRPARATRSISTRCRPDDLAELYEWTPKIAAALQQRTPTCRRQFSDQQNKGLETDLVIDRDAAARLGLTVSQIDNTLYDAFGQRQVSTIYVARNQYHVIMEVAPRYWQTRRR
jgi:multidrug efflux pump